MEIKDPATKPRLFIEIIESMRGIASLGVVCFHFSHGTMPSLMPNSFSGFFEWAKLGIPLFFVISGFIIPYSMYAAGYTIRDAGRYFMKRMVRMTPPAWASIGVIFCIYFAAVAYKGSPIEGMTWPGFSAKAIIANLLFSFKLFDIENYIEVYWTLEVEFQFYIIIVLVFPLIMKYSSNLIALSVILIALNATYFLHGGRILFFELNTFFIMGLLLFLYKMHLIPRNYFIYASCLAAVACYAQVGMMHAYAASIGILLIAFVRFEHPITNFLGTISFSLYITHHNTGIVLEFFLRNFYGPESSDIMKFAMFLIYVFAAIGAGWIFYKLVEEPSLRLSKRIAIKSGKK